MGNTQSHTVMLADRIESAIQFGKKKVIFQEQGLHEELNKLKPHFKNLGYGIFWEEKHVKDGIQMVSDSYNGLSVDDPIYPAPIQITPCTTESKMFERTRIETIVEVKPIKDLVNVKKIDWDCVLSGKTNCS